MASFNVVIPARDEAPTVAGVVTAARAARGVERVFVVGRQLAMTRELLDCLRFVPLWTYRAYLSRLQALPPAE